MIYGALPEDLGLIDLSPTEMMFWLYCPIATPGEETTLPDNLVQFRPIIERVIRDDADRYCDSYVYLTAKTLYVSGDYIGNRPGWHSDGFGTDDINYIWYDHAPTEFYEGRFHLPDDCDDSMEIMEKLAGGRPIVTYPAKHLLKLTPAGRISTWDADLRQGVDLLRALQPRRQLAEPSAAGALASRAPVPASQSPSAGLRGDRPTRPRSPR